MGLLDDAIREHLDLKRRRGADPTEVARMEQEALGPVRREAAPAEPAAGEQAAPADAPASAEPTADVQHPLDEGLQVDDATHVVAPEDRHEPPHGDPLHEQPPDPPEQPDPAVAATEPEPQQPDPRHSDIVHQPTTEFRVEDHHDDPGDEDERPQPDEDVLEETPDFLQETPEHDRLWFEQRPPRDFDFDG